MLSNESVVQKFIDKKDANNRNLTSENNKLYSYNLCIARWNFDSDCIEILSIPETSVTTRKHVANLYYSLTSRYKFIAAVNRGGYSYSRYQFPNNDEKYSNLLFEDTLLWRFKKKFDENFAFNKSCFTNYSGKFDSHNFQLYANYHYQSDKIFEVNTEKKIIIKEPHIEYELAFAKCDVCKGLGFTLTKNLTEKKCECSRGWIICLKSLN